MITLAAVIAGVLLAAALHVGLDFQWFSATICGIAVAFAILIYDLVHTVSTFHF